MFPLRRHVQSLKAPINTHCTLTRHQRRPCPWELQEKTITYYVPTPEEAKELDMLWEMFDTDDSGELCTSEFRDALRILGVEADEDFMDIYNAIDLDGSGLIDKDEFASWWFGNPPAEESTEDDDQGRDG
jgi:Ca2+-binding EF-hand superfamily protein